MYIFAVFARRRAVHFHYFIRDLFICLFIYNYWAVSTAGVPREKKGITVLGTIIH